jgi:hypothetical protein
MIAFLVIIALCFLVERMGHKLANQSDRIASLEQQVGVLQKSSTREYNNASPT